MHDRAGYDPDRLKALFFSSGAMTAEIERVIQFVTVGAVARLKRLLTGRIS